MHARHDHRRGADRHAVARDDARQREAVALDGVCVQAGVVADNAVAAKGGERRVQQHASAVGVGAEPGAECQVDQTQQWHGQEVGANQAVEQQQVEKDVYLRRELTRRSIGEIALLQRPPAQEQAIHRERVKVGDDDAGDHQDHAAEVAERQSAQHKCRGADTRHRDDAEEGCEGDDLRRGDLLH